MLKDTLLKALNKYKICLALGHNNGANTTINIRHHIDECESYLLRDNKVDGTWLEENHDILYKAVKHSHYLVHSELAEGIKNDNLEEEHKDLNKCMNFYKNFYKKTGLISNNNLQNKNQGA